MHGTNVKIIEAQQASLCNSYKNTKLKLLKWSFFNVNFNIFQDNSLEHQLVNK